MPAIRAQGALLQGGDAEVFFVGASLLANRFCRWRRLGLKSALSPTRSRKRERGLS